MTVQLFLTIFPFVFITTTILAVVLISYDAKREMNESLKSLLPREDMQYIETNIDSDWSDTPYCFQRYAEEAMNVPFTDFSEDLKSHNFEFLSKKEKRNFMQKMSEKYDVSIYDIVRRIEELKILKTEGTYGR